MKMMNGVTISADSLVIDADGKMHFAGNVRVAYIEPESSMSEKCEWGSFNQTSEEDYVPPPPPPPREVLAEPTQFKSGVSADGNLVTLKRLGPIESEIDYDVRPNADCDILNVVVLDTETTGLSAADEMVEIAIARFETTSSGRFTRFVGSDSWLNEPSRPMHPAAERITGITLEKLAGHSFDDDEIMAALAWADVIVAHNARFDLQKMMKRYSDVLAGKMWLCSYQLIDWAGHGHDSAKLSTLAYEHGFFYGKHRAEADVHALAYLISLNTDDLANPGNRCTYLEEMLRRTEDKIHLHIITKSPYATRSIWSGRGYRWSPDDKVWWCEKSEVAIAEEVAFTRGLQGIQSIVRVLPFCKLFAPNLLKEAVMIETEASLGLDGARIPNKEEDSFDI